MHNQALHENLKIQAGQALRRLQTKTSERAAQWSSFTETIAIKMVWMTTGTGSAAVVL
jgi:hypothetical protein